MQSRIWCGKHKTAPATARADHTHKEHDMEDIEFFGLNDDDAPVKANRTRRSKAQIEAEKAQEFATA